MTTPTARSAAAVRTGLVAALAASVAVGSYGIFSADEVTGNGTSPTTVAGAGGDDGSGTDTDADNGNGSAPFTTADVGACLTWDIAADGTISNFQQASCDGEHRFEISAREDLAAYPSSEFGQNASMPDLTRQAQLREELCQTPTLRYLGGRFDPVGRYSIAPILPPAEAWEAGDRTMLCGIQATDAAGVPMLTTGAAAEQDQAVVAQPGECVFVDDSRSLRTVDCAENHQLETTSIVDLAPVFPEGTPSIEDQDRHLQDVCTRAAIDYLGDEEALYQSTLQPYWGTLGQASWIGGSRSVNCSLFHANPEGGFSNLNRSAREDLLIDGEPPAEQPPRNPLREQPAP
ncbi:septum formation family protein [Corynebacterium sp.]|uniref:septum formation family protein n=1 Tax=Corynebacterium sp. TaxID=1720 RepID=UPI0026E0CD43|nr:septum formation family protein [Corynebacterium sp.]MDO5511274.1 septum formation family protein [Corynebacterium sp.]